MEDSNSVAEAFRRSSTPHSPWGNLPHPGASSINNPMEKMKIDWASAAPNHEPRYHLRVMRQCMCVVDAHEGCRHADRFANAWTQIHRIIEGCVLVCWKCDSLLSGSAEKAAVAIVSRSRGWERCANHMLSLRLLGAFGGQRMCGSGGDTN